MKRNQRPARWIWLFVFLPLSGCEMVQSLPYVGKGLPEAESRAIGAGCRHAGRAIEDCFAINPRATRSGIFAGWRDMNDYMTTGKIGEVKPLVAANTPPPVEVAAKDEHDTDHEDEDPGDKPAKKSGKGAADNSHDTVADKSDTKLASKASDKSGGKSGADKGAADKHAAKGGDKGSHAAPDDEKSADKPAKASAKYVTSADRPPPTAKTSPRPRWEPGKKDTEGEEAPKVWERKPRT